MGGISEPFAAVPTHRGHDMATDHRNASPTRFALLGAAAVLAAASAVGCQNDRDGARATRPRVVHGEQFPAEGQVRPVERFVHVQSAAAARSDATLNADHFDGRGSLNSLGRRKLDLMLHDDSAPPLVVYVDLSRSTAAARAAGAEAPLPEAHHTAVRAYLADRGVNAEQLDLRNGPNVGNTRPARDGLRGLKAFRGDGAAAEESDNSVYNRGVGAGSAELLGIPGNK